MLATYSRAELPEGKPQVLLHPPKHILVIRIGDEVFALESVCSHAGASLFNGKICNNTIECRAHAFRFALQTGQLVRGDEPCQQRVYRVLRSGEIWQVFADTEPEQCSL